MSYAPDPHSANEVAVTSGGRAPQGLRVLSSAIVAVVDRHPRALLVAVIVGAHCYAAWAFGATFWVDSLAYIQLGEAMATPGGLAGFYDGTGRWIYGHLQPGVPLLWLALSKLPSTWQWPALALLQHVVAAVAALYAFRVVSSIWPGRVHIVAAVVLCFLPFYQAFHAALLTESLTGSLLLMGFALALDLRPGRPWSSRRFLLLLACVMAIGQLRSYYALIVAAYAGLVLLQRGEWLSWRQAAVAGALGASVLAFPVYRLAETGLRFLPEAGFNSLLCALRANPTPSAAAMAPLAALPLPDGLDVATIAARGLDYPDALAIARHWRAQGMDQRAIGEAVSSASRAILGDGMPVTFNRVAYGLASTGFASPVLLLPAEREPFRGYSPSAYFRHLVSTYRFHSWLARDGYAAWFDTFFRGKPQLPELAPAQRFLDPWGDWLRRRSRSLRDPLALGRLPPDLFALGGLVAIAGLWRRARDVSLLIAGTIAIAFLVAAAFPVGNPRYAYPLFPLFILGVSILLAARRPRPEPA